MVVRDEHATLHAEVLELERKLAQKRKEEAAAKTKLDSTTAQIEKIRHKFGRQLARLETKQTAISADEAECVAEADVLAAARKKAADEARQQKLQELKLRKQTAGIYRQLQVAKHLQTILKAREHANAGLDKTAQTSGMAAKRLQHKIEEAVRRLDDASALKARLEANIDSHRTRIGDIDRQLPSLHDEKKSVVAAKNFKEAKRVSSDIKELTAERYVSPPRTRIPSLRPHTTP